jgi:hypothetical protein
MGSGTGPDDDDQDDLDDEAKEDDNFDDLEDSHDNMDTDKHVKNNDVSFSPKEYQRASGGRSVMQDENSCMVKEAFPEVSKLLFRGDDQDVQVETDSVLGQ